MSGSLSVHECLAVGVVVGVGQCWRECVSENVTISGSVVLSFHFGYRTEEVWS